MSLWFEKRPFDWARCYPALSNYRGPSAFRDHGLGARDDLRICTTGPKTCLLKHAIRARRKAFVAPVYVGLLEPHDPHCPRLSTLFFGQDFVRCGRHSP